MSDGLEILHLINTRGGCLLSEITTILCIPKDSVQSWISLWCSTGYLTQEGGNSKECACRKDGRNCICCCGSCKEETMYEQSRIELTERGKNLIRRVFNDDTR